MARLRATVVPVTESSDPSAASLPPTSSAAGASFLRARPPRPLLLILPPPAARPLTCCRPRALAAFRTQRVTSDNAASPISQHRRRPSPLLASRQRRCVRPRTHRALLQTQRQCRRSPPLDSLTVTIPPRARVVIGASLCSTIDEPRRRRCSSFHFEGVSLFTRRRTLIDHVFQPLIVEATFLLIRSINRTYLSLSLCRKEERRRENSFPFPELFPNVRVSFFNTALLFLASNDVSPIEPSS